MVHVFPIIDISGIDDLDRQLVIAKEVTKACSEWGFLLIKGHTVPSAEIKELFNLSREFFHLPDEQKEPWGLTSESTGYVGSFKDRNRDDKMSMWFSGLKGDLAGKLDLAPYWHDYIDKVESFKSKCHDLMLKLLTCFAVAMNLPNRNHFAEAHRDDVGMGDRFRMILYPARERQIETTGSRMGEHTDSGSLTLLFQTTAALEIMSPSGEGSRLLVSTVAS
jgi:isopenicillin N synthase-like dioxygenase